MGNVSVVYFKKNYKFGLQTIWYVSNFARYWNRNFNKLSPYIYTSTGFVLKGYDQLIS
jgi:hypothetical protein